MKFDDVSGKADNDTPISVKAYFGKPLALLFILLLMAALSFGLVIALVLKVAIGAMHIFGAVALIVALGCLGVYLSHKTQGDI